MSIRKRLLACVMALVMALTLTTATAFANGGYTLLQIPEEYAEWLEAQGKTLPDVGYFIDLDINFVNQVPIVDGTPAFYAGEIYMTAIAEPGHEIYQFAPERESSWYPGVINRYAGEFGFAYFAYSGNVEVFAVRGVPITHIVLRMAAAMDGIAAPYVHAVVPVTFGSNNRATVKGTLTLRGHHWDVQEMIFTKDGEAPPPPPPPPAPVLTIEPAGDFATVSNVRQVSESLPKDWHTRADAYEYLNTEGLKAFYCDAPVTLSFDDSVEFIEVAYNAEYDDHLDWGVISETIPGHRGAAMTFSLPGTYLFTYVFYNEDGDVDSTSFYFVMGAGDAPPPPPPEPVPPLFGDLANVSIEGLTNIEYVFEKELMSGSGGNFMPFANARNAQFLAILSRLAGAGVTDGAVWFQPYVDWAKEFGIIEEGEFNADGDMAREDMALWLYRYITISGIELPSWNGKPDYQDIADLSEEQRIAAEALFDWNIIRGSTPGEVFGTGNSSERVALANVLARFVRMLP